MIASTISWVAINSARCPCSARSEASMVYATDETGSAMIVNANARNSTALVTGRSGPWGGDVAATVSGAPGAGRSAAATRLRVARPGERARSVIAVRTPCRRGGADEIADPPQVLAQQILVAGVQG